VKRRQFIKTSISAGLFSIVPRFVLGGNGFTAPSDQLTKAVIGVGGMGSWHALSTPGKLLAICDVDKNHLKRTQNDAGGKIDVYHDFREVLARDDIDIVHIATPPHWHGIMSVMAAKAGKDVWCEKPMTRTIGEGQKVIEAVEQNGTIFRINTWFRFQSNFYGFGTPVKPIKKLVESGLLGWPLKVNININTGFAWKFYWQGKKELNAQWIPQELDYNSWLGPAPYKPYSKHRVHSSFRGYWDYDGGGLGDMGQHYLDPVQYLLGKDNTGPVEIEVDAEQAHYDAVGTWRRIWMKYKDGCQITLSGDTKKEKIPFLEGPDGKLFRGFKSDIPDLEKKLASLPEPQEQITDFHYSVKERKQFALNATNGHRSASLVNLGKIALRLGRKLYFDPEKQIFINDEAANRLINQPARSPWIL